MKFLVRIGKTRLTRKVTKKIEKLTLRCIYDVGGISDMSETKVGSCWVSRSSKRMPPETRVSGYSKLWKLHSCYNTWQALRVFDSEHQCKKRKVIQAR